MGSYALLGERLGHSLSPQLHKAIYAQLGHTDSEFRAIEVAPNDVADFFAGFAVVLLMALTSQYPIRKQPYNI